ncbi:MAG: hypothetical protein PHU65_04335 [Actinomycetota bacterium]|nr:hypothetical protein [Actinomycetota bacterium]
MVSFLKNLKNFFAPSPYSADNFIKINVKCKICGEEINVGLRKTSDFSRVYESDEAPSGSSFMIRKEVLGKKCNNLIYLTIYFDENFRVISKEIKGGEFL